VTMNMADEFVGHVVSAVVARPGTLACSLHWHIATSGILRTVHSATLSSGTLWLSARSTKVHVL
jgi:hypothetical protein